MEIYTLGNRIGNKETHIFHNPVCHKARLIRHDKLKWFQSSAHAVNDGYIPCKLCKPERNLAWDYILGIRRGTYVPIQNNLPAEINTVVSGTEDIYQPIKERTHQISATGSNLNLFQRHLNGTTVLAILLGFAFIGFGSLEALEIVICGIGSLLYNIFDNHFDNRELIFIIIGLGVCLPVLGWTIKRKNRSLWSVFITLIPFGWIVFLFLGDKELDEAREIVEQLQAKIDYHNYIYFSLDSPEISDAEYDEFKKELKQLREKHPQLSLGVTPSGNRWRQVRQALCWAGIVAIIVFMVVAARYEASITGGYWDLIELDAGGVRWVWTEIKDYSIAPLWVKIGWEHGLIPFIVAVFMLYGALRK